MIASQVFAAAAALLILATRVVAAEVTPTATAPKTDPTLEKLNAHQVPNLGRAAESYFSPDSRKLICDARREGDAEHHVYTLNLDGTDIRRINDKGKDGCSFFLPDGKRLAWTSTRDNLDMPPGDWSGEYPQGAEIYVSDLEGGNVARLTHNKYYDAEITASTDGRYLVIGRETEGKMDLWRLAPDGNEPEFQVTKLEGWEPGGSQYIPGTHTLLFRAWPSKKADEKPKDPNDHKPLRMEIFTIKDDGTDLKQLTNDGATNWAPYPAPDGKHYVFAKVFDRGNFEVVLGSYDSAKQVRLTYNDAFDGFPSISPDGKWLSFSSSRGSKPGDRATALYLADISGLGLGPQTKDQSAK